MDQLDIHAIPKPFRNPNWRPPQRRNKNVKQIISDASRKETSVLVTQNNSGVSTPLDEADVSHTTESATPTLLAGGTPPNLAQATRELSVIARSGAARNVVSVPPTVTYTNIESAPSLHPSSQRHYCDITGLPAPYTDPKSRLRFHNGEIFALVKELGQHQTESYLAARGAHTVLK